MKFKQTLIGLRTVIDDSLAHLHCTVYGLNCPLVWEASRKMPAKHLLYALYISPRYRYVYVDNPKTGCSSLKSALVELEARDVRNDVDCYDWKVLHNRDRSILQQLTDLKSPRPLSYLVDNGYRFISFVRNPYSRLISGYRDKIRKPHYRQELLRLMGANPNDLERPISFAEFAHLVTGQNDYDMNPHWRPQTSQILYDLIDYSFLGRFENYNEEFVRLFKHLGISETEIPALRNLNWTQGTQAENLGEWYTPEIQALVFQRYRQDFENFGYGYDV